MFNKKKSAKSTLVNSSSQNDKPKSAKKKAVRKAENNAAAVKSIRRNEAIKELNKYGYSKELASDAFDMAEKDREKRNSKPNRFRLTKSAQQAFNAKIINSRLHKVRSGKGTKRSASPTYTVTVYMESTGRKTFATPEEARIYAQRLANRQGKNTVVIPGYLPVTHRYNLR